LIAAVLHTGAQLLRRVRRVRTIGTTAAAERQVLRNSRRCGNDQDTGDNDHSGENP
jgi:hypothetical protein